jgi:hypothetical protein
MRMLELLGGLIVAIAFGVGVAHLLVVFCRGLKKNDHNDEEKRDGL